LSAEDAFDRENVASVTYLRAIADELDLVTAWGR